MKTKKTVTAGLPLGLLGLVTACLITPAFPADKGGKVIPANANPYGYSLDNMASAMAELQTSGGFAAYPATPFQILYCGPSCSATPTSPPACPLGNGTLFVAGSNFAVSSGTSFFVPLFLFDDTPPVLGVWPANKSAAKEYIFGPTNYAAEGAKIIVDGEATNVGPEFLGGPITATPFGTPPSPSAPSGGGPTIDGVQLPYNPGGLLDALPASFCQTTTGASIPGCGTAGSHFIQLGVFLTPMSVGNHSVEIKGQLGNSPLFVQALGPFDGACLQEDITYKVTVRPSLNEE